MPTSEKGHYYIDIIRSSDDSLFDRKYYGCVKLKTDNSYTNFICVEKDEAFRINVKNVERTDKETYGAVLYLDGQRVHGKKTFFGKTSFLGFKLGNGQFKQFVFSTPQLLGQQENNQDNDNKQKRKYILDQDGSNKTKEQMIDEKHQGKKGTIIIEFYKCEQFERKYIPNKVHTKTYEQHFIEDGTKKNFKDQLSIKQGKTFSVKSQGANKRQLDVSKNMNSYPFQKKRDGKFDDKRRNSHNDLRSNYNKDRLPGGTITDKGMLIDYKVLYDQQVDQIVIHYAEWSYLQFMKFVDIKKYDHLRLIPKSLMTSQEFVYKTLWTVVRESGKLHYTKANEEYYKATGFKISDFFEFREKDMEQFVKLKHQMFQIDEKGYIKSLEFNEQEVFNHTPQQNKKGKSKMVNTNKGLQEIIEIE